MTKKRQCNPRWPNNPNYVTLGEWSWDTKRFWTKVDKKSVKECWEWLGSTSKTGALYGARKLHNGEFIQQMIYARRIAWTEHYKEDVSPYQIKMKCKNVNCVNARHMYTEPNNRLPKDEL